MPRPGISGSSTRPYCPARPSRSIAGTCRPPGRPSGRSGSEARPRSGSPPPSARSSAARRAWTWGSSRRPVGGPGGHRPPPDQPAHRRQPVLGARPDRPRRPSWPRPTTPSRFLDRLLAEARAIARRGQGDLPVDRPLWRPLDRAGAGGVDPLQRRRPGHGGLRDGPGRDLRRTRIGHAAPRLRRRDPAPAPGGEAHRLGAASAGRSRSP